MCSRWSAEGKVHGTLTPASSASQGSSSCIFSPKRSFSVPRHPMALDSAVSFCTDPLGALPHCSLTCPVRRSGWDIHDTTYSKELLISNKANGFRDLLAAIDLSTYRRIPWEKNVPFFLVSFLDPDTKQPLFADPRGVLKRVVGRAASKGWQCYAGCEYEVSGQRCSV